MPAWVIFSVASLLAVIAAQSVTQNTLTIALLGAWVETGVYYATLLWRDVRSDRSRQASYGLRGFNRTLLNLTLELGVAEAVDTFFTRPLLLWAATRTATIATSIDALTSDREP